jgi:hypothetical protein
MFVQHSVHIDRPIEGCARTLSRGPRRWFPRLGHKNHYGVGPRIAGLPLRKRVMVEAGEPEQLGDWTAIPITWKASFPEKLFPAMTGKVELSPVDGRITRVTVSGMYEPPLGRVGKELDDALMHRVAEATVKELADSIGQMLESSLR